MLGQELIIACISSNELHSVVVVMPGPVISFCHKVLYIVSWHARVFFFLVL